MENLVMLCAQHHLGVKHASGWSLTGDADVAPTWRGPGGKRWVVRPSVICPERLYRHLPGHLHGPGP